VRLAPFVLVVALLLPACGSDSDDRERWAQEANALCRQLERELGSFDPPREIEEPDELAGFVGAVGRAVAGWLEEMRALEPPDGEEQDVERMLALYGRAVRQTEQAADALGAGDEERYEALVRAAEKPSGEADAIAREFGADACTYPLSG
jgi:hypothetical protein